MLYEYNATRKSFYVYPEPDLLKNIANLYDINGDIGEILSMNDQIIVKKEIISMFRDFNTWAKETHRLKYNKHEFDHCMSQFAGFLKSANEQYYDTIKCTIGSDKSIWLLGLRNSAMWVVTNLSPKTEDKEA